MIDRPRGDESVTAGGRDDYSNALPLVRDIGEIVRCLAVSEAEVRHQIARLERHVQSRTEKEAQYHRELLDGYRTTARYLAILRRYQQGRLENGGRAPEPYREEMVDERGVMGAYTEE